jgi:lipopolysaccharide export system protein LptA
MSWSKKIQIIILLCLSAIILFYSYYYLPNKNKGSINIEVLETKKLKEEINAKNTFTNTEYKSQNSKGEIYTTIADESFIYQNEPDIINLIYPYSFTKLKKDNSLIEIRSEIGTFDKIKNISSYEKNVNIKNKNYLITADSAKHFSSKNIIIINGNVVMKDLTMGLSHVAYCDRVEIDTETNNAMASMNSTTGNVIAKKLK